MISSHTALKIRFVAPLLAFALIAASGLKAQQTVPSTTTPDPVSQTTAMPTTTGPMTKDQLKAQKKQEKQQEKAANANAKAAKAQAKAKKDQDKALQEQEKTAGTVPKN